MKRKNKYEIIRQEGKCRGFGGDMNKGQKMKTKIMSKFWLLKI